MSRYYVLEGNIERLEQKLKTISNKCERYGCEFLYSRVGEEYRQIKVDDISEITAKFIIVEVAGKAEVNGWRFVATIEHTPNGNVLHPYGSDDVQIPIKYRTTDPICEHCNTKRRRNDTYLIYNEDTDEWKQVGKSCLRDFTGGLDAEYVAKYISYFDEIIKGESVSASGSYIPYYCVTDILKYAAECVKHFGYYKSSALRSTADRCFEYYLVDNDKLRSSADYIERLRQEMAECQFLPSNNNKLVKDAIDWVLSSQGESDYIYNLKVICKANHVTRRNLGLLASLIPSYTRHIERESELKKQVEEAKFCPSKHIGNIGDKIEFDSTVKCLTSVDTEYGVSFLYKFVDSEGNIFTWFTSKWIDTRYHYHIKGTVKGHDEFRGCKQTSLTRCRLSEI